MHLRSNILSVDLHVRVAKRQTARHQYTHQIGTTQVFITYVIGIEYTFINCRRCRGRHRHRQTIKINRIRRTVARGKKKSRSEVMIFWISF